MIFLEFGATKPAPLVLTPRARYMVTLAELSFGSRPTLRTICEVFIALSIREKLGVCFYILCAIFSLMPLVSALKAHLEVAGVTNASLFLRLVSLYEIETSWARTPPKIRIEINDDILLEFEIFRVYVLRAKLPHVFLLVYLITASLHARNLQNLSI